MAAWLEGRRYRATIRTGPALVSFSAEPTSWFPCTVPGGVKRWLLGSSVCEALLIQGEVQVLQPGPTLFL